MRHARKYVVGYKGQNWVVDTRETWPDAQKVATVSLAQSVGRVHEVYALVPVAAWKCVQGKDGTRRMVKVKAKSVTGDGKGGAA